MDAFELLKADHKKVAELFDKLEAASGNAKLSLFQQIKSELDLHAHVEETIFYPALEKPEETHDLTLEAYEEHKVIKTLLSELGGAKSADDEWQAKAKVLRENVEHHVEEEEDELFDKANDALSDEEIESLGEQMETEKARKQGQPAPRRAEAKAAQSSKSSGGKSILSRIADFVGLGSGTAKKTGTKKASAKKSTASSKRTKVKKTASKKKSTKSKAATVRKSSSAGSRKAAGTGSTSGARKKGAAGGNKRSSTSARKRSGTGAGKKVGKKRARI